MNTLRHLCVIVAFAAILASGCGAPHGQPSKGSEVLAPNEVMDFATLYAENCAGCHGAEGRGGAAIALANPVYLAIADDAAIRKVVLKGVLGTPMPAFGQSSGGMLTDAQIDVITKEIRSRWSKHGILDAATVPSYAPKSAGDAQRGEVAYKTFCESCHGPDGGGGKKAAPLRMIRFWRSSAIRDCAPPSSQAALNWERLIGGETYRADQCLMKKLPTSLPGSHHAAF